MNPISVKSIYSREELCFQAPAEPCGIIIFGASGDLTHRKLIPALYDLSHQKLLPKQFFLLGSGNTDLNDVSFRQKVETSLKRSEKDKLDPAIWDDFLKSCYYERGGYEDPATYTRLKERLETLEKTHRTRGNRLFYLAIPPHLDAVVTHLLGNVKLLQRPGPEIPWSRIVFEKPFGSDLKSTFALNAEIQKVLSEDQIYRIDHYLGKETVQNILMFRFANTIFEPVWTREYIDHVQITVSESLGVEHRARYYEGAGVIRDMFQNHIFQLLCLVAMEPPASFDADHLDDEKIKILQSIRPFTQASIPTLAIRGQYGPSRVNGKEVIGYRDEENVQNHSTTDTFAAITFFIDNWRWQGVPVYLRSGKRLKKSFAEIAIQFRRVPHLIFRGVSSEVLNPNTLIFRIQPDEGIFLTFEAKHPGAKLCLSSVTMNFNYQEAYGMELPGAYERLLLDCMTRDKTLFSRSDWLELSWKLLMPLIDSWATQEAPGYPNYPSGSWGPKAADSLLEQDGRRWRNPTE